MNFSPIYWLIVIWEQRTTPKREKKQEVVVGARPFYFINKAYPTTTTARRTYKTSKAKMKMVDYVLNYKEAALASRPPFTA